MSKSKRLSSCLLFLAGLRDPESLLYVLDVHLVRRILHIRWQPIRIEKEDCIEYRDPDSGQLDSVADAPAVIYAQGTRRWYKDGKRHRDGDAPDVMQANGACFWHKDGKLHRDNDKPAVVWADGSRFWFKQGELHRDGDEPAIIRADGSCWWYEEG